MRALLCSYRIQSALEFAADAADFAESGEPALVPQIDDAILLADQGCRRFQRLLHTFTIFARWWCL